MDVSFALSDDSVDGGETKPRAFSHFLRREERLEDVSSGGLVHSAAGIAYPKQHIAPRRDVGFVPALRALEMNVARRDPEPTTPGHRLAGVHRQVGDHLLHLAEVCL